MAPLVNSSLQAVGGEQQAMKHAVSTAMSGDWFDCTQAYPPISHSNPKSVENCQQMNIFLRNYSVTTSHLINVPLENSKNQFRRIQ